MDKENSKKNKTKENNSNSRVEFKVNEQVTKYMPDHTKVKLIPTPVRLKRQMFKISSKGIQKALKRNA